MPPLSLGLFHDTETNDGMRYTNSVIPTPIQQTPCLPRELVASPVFLLGRLGFTIKKQAMQELKAQAAAATTTAFSPSSPSAAAETQATIADTLHLDRASASACSTASRKGA